MVKHNSIKELIRGTGYWVLNKKIVKQLGVETAFLLSSFADAEDMLSDKDGWFYQTTETVENITTLSRYKQDRCIKQLEDIGILQKQTRGLPPKRYFKIDYDSVTNLLVSNSHIDMLETDKSNSEKLATSKELSNKSLSNEELSNTKDIVEQTPPHVEIIDYLNQTAGRRYQHTTPATQRFIKARLNEGFTVQDFKQVVDNKYHDWHNDREMSTYLRPETLFGTKFESYLNQTPQPKKEESVLKGVMF